MKKPVALILCLMLAFALASCSSVKRTEPTTALPSDTVAPSDTDGTTESGAATTAPCGGGLFAYDSEIMGWLFANRKSR